MLQNSGKNIFRVEQTTNQGTADLFRCEGAFTEKKQLHFWTLSTNNQGTVYVFGVSKRRNFLKKRSTVVRKLERKYE